jgi:ParB family chromosome partitioning protein
MQKLVEVSPFRCKSWDGHGRMEEYVTEATCRSEIESVAANGQLLPVIARSIATDPNYDFEIISGSRRLFVARHLNIRIRLEVRDLTDKECIVVFDHDNRLRKDISPYERGRSFVAWLAAGHFASQDDIAACLKISPSQVSRLMKLAKLPAVIVSAFARPTEICEGWGPALLDLWQNRAERHRLIARARRIGQLQQRPSAGEVFERLVAPGALRGARGAPSRDDVVLGSNGQALFRIKHHRDAIAVVIKKHYVTDSVLKQITEALSKTLQNTEHQVIPRGRNIKPAPGARRREDRLSTSNSI